MPQDFLGPSQMMGQQADAHETPHSDRESVKMPMDVAPVPPGHDVPIITSATFEMVLCFVPPTEHGDE